MSETTEISYSHHTASPWYGCTEVSPGCAGCFAREWGKRFHIEWGRGKPRMRSKSFEANVRKWDRYARNAKRAWDRAVSEFGDKNYLDGGLTKAGFIKPERPRIFLSLCDWLDPEVPIEWLADCLRVIHETPNLDWLLSTKRPELWRLRIDHAIPSMECGGTEMAAWLNGNPPPNVWLGVTVESPDQEDRVNHLLKIPAKVRWVSAEPLLEKIVLPLRCPSCGYTKMDQLIHGDHNLCNRGRFPEYWVVVGGESGKNRRDCGVDAIVDIARQCRDAGVPVWVKQDCALKPGQQGRIPDEIWNLKQLPRVNENEEHEEAVCCPAT